MEVESELRPKLPEAVLSDSMIADMKAKVGLRLRIDHSVNNEVATRLAIAKFAAGIGDTNELWLDPEVARHGPFGELVAPPAWVISCFAGVQFGWPGLGSFHSGSDLTFHRPVYEDDRITASCTYEGFEGPSPSRFAGQAVTDHFVNRYTNQRSELVAEIRWTVINFERLSAKARASSRAEVSLELPHRWRDDQLRQLEAEILAEMPRGRVPRYWEDVQVGDSLDEIVKGPIGITDEVAFLVSGAVPIPRLSAHRSALRAYRRHPAWAFRDPETSALEPIYSVHYNRRAAQAMGVAMEYDVGFQRQCWQVHAVNDWMGDDGWLKSASAQYRSFVYLSDIVRLGGAVVAKRVDDDGEHIVEIETTAVNQRGQNVMPGRAVVALPSSAESTSPATIRSRREAEPGRGSEQGGSW